MSNLCLNILLVEDNPVDARIFRGLLDETELDYKLVVARSKSAALTFSEHLDYAIIFVDLNLPDGKGMSLIKLLRERGDDVPIVIVSELQSPKIMDEASSLGVSRYLVKGNFASQELLEELQKSIGRSLPFTEQAPPAE